jgi:hypothetical protein
VVIINQFTLGTSLNSINHEMGSAMKMSCYVIIHFLVHDNVGYARANIVHKMCLFFLRSSLAGNRDHPYIRVFGIVALNVNCTPVCGGGTNSLLLKNYFMSHIA